MGVVRGFDAPHPQVIIEILDDDASDDGNAEEPTADDGHLELNRFDICK